MRESVAGRIEETLLAHWQNIVAIAAAAAGRCARIRDSNKVDLPGENLCDTRTFKFWCG